MDTVQLINEKTNLALKITNALGYNLPPPFLFGKSVVVDPDLGKSDYDKKAFNEKYGSTPEDMVFLVPVKLRLDKEKEDKGFWLPLDPLISVSGKNIIRRRYVAKSKMRGSIKETWSQDDYEVTIAGLIQGDDQDDVHKRVKKLRKYLEAAEAIHVTCDVLNNAFKIHRIAVESYDFPFTKGMENQAFTIKAYSDDNYQLLEEL